MFLIKHFKSPNKSYVAHKIKLDFSPSFELTKASAKLEVAISNQLGGDAFTRKYIISPLTLTLGQGQTQNINQYPLHHLTYAPAKFEAAMSNGFGENAFTRNICFELDLCQGHMKHCPLHHVTYVPAKFEVAAANG